MRIVASMTTVPSRIGLFRPALESLVNQTVAIEGVELNLPYFCKRTGQPYVVPDWLADMDRVKVFRTEDFGPITKIAPTLLRHSDDPDTFIWSCDDDFAYPSNQLALLCRYHDPRIRRILTRYGALFLPNGSIGFAFGAMEVAMFEGFGTVLYPPNCISEDFAGFVRSTSEDVDCRESDDVVLSHYFAEHGVPIFLCNQPTEAEPFELAGSLPYGQENGLRQQGGGHLARYDRVRKLLQSRPPLVSTHLKLMRALWRTVDPYEDQLQNSHVVDLQGWNSSHDFLVDSIAAHRPAIVVEVGVWKGASTIAMAKQMRDCQIDGAVIAIDTWLGAWDHWNDDHWFADLSFKSGYPQLFHKFIRNVFEENVQDIVVPLPLDSSNAYNVLRSKGIVPDIVHIDGAHDYDAVLVDVKHWWSLLRTGGILVADDYYDDGTWPGVRAAVDDFLLTTPHRDFEFRDGKCRVTKI